MRQLLACLLLLAVGVLPSLGTTHAHTPDDASVPAVQHTHGIGLAHAHEGPEGHREDGDPLNLDGDRRILVGRIAASAPVSPRAAVGWHAHAVADDVSATPMLRAADCSWVTGGLPPKRDQLAIRVTAPRRGPPQPSV